MTGLINFYKLPAAQYNAEIHGNSIFQASDTGQTWIFGEQVNAGILYIDESDEGGFGIDTKYAFYSKKLLDGGYFSYSDTGHLGSIQVLLDAMKEGKVIVYNVTEDADQSSGINPNRMYIGLYDQNYLFLISYSVNNNGNGIIRTHQLTITPSDSNLGVNIDVTTRPDRFVYTNADTIPMGETSGEYYIETDSVKDCINKIFQELKGTTESLENHKNDQDKKHIPEGGHEKQILSWKASGEAKWEDLANVFTGLEEILAYGVEWDITVADPVLTRIGNMQLHKTLPIQSAFKGCIYANGEVQYYLDPDDWSKKEDGTGSVRNGEDGIVCVEIPEFYYKSEVDGNKGRMWVSTIQIDSTWHKQEALYVDAYRATMVRDNSSLSSASGYLTSFTNNDIVSIVNTDTAFRGGTNSTTYDTYLSTDQFRTLLGKPVTNQGRTNMRNYMGNAIDSNQRLMSYEEYKNIFYWLYVIEYANFNSQAAYNAELTSEGYHQGGLGEGLTTGNWNNWTSYNGNNPITPCGYGDDLGNRTGIKDITVDMNGSITFHMPRWRGFDNPFGDIWTNLDGILIDTPLTGAGDSGVTPTCYIITNPNNYTDSLDSVEDVADRIYTLPHNKGYIKRQHTNQNGDIAVAELGGSATTYICDYYYVNYDDTPETLLVGGSLVSGSSAGLGDFYCGNRVANTNTDVGFRTVRPKN